LLQRLHISNYAIIDEIELRFSENLTVITGETGAGKSILVGALWLILGERADTSVLFDKEKKCIVEGDFNIHGHHLQNFFKQHDLDYNAHTILRREINPAGKSRAFINDTPVALSLLRELGRTLVDVHSQFETLDLDTTDFQFTVIDILSNQQKVVTEYQTKYKLYKSNLAELEKLREEQKKAVQEQDFIKFQLGELHEAELEAEEQSYLDQQLQELNHAEEIKHTLTQAGQLLSEDTDSAAIKIKEALQAINHITKFSSSVQQLQERLNSVKIELDDIADELDKLNNTINYDAGKIAELTSRLDLIYRLQKKHRVNSNTELLQLKNDFENKLQNIKVGDDRLTQLQLQTERELQELKKLGTLLSSARKKQIPSIEKAVNTLLVDAGMPFAQLKIGQNKLPENTFNNYGSDDIEFQFSSNKGSAFHSIGKIASGGELSRLMLCIKSLIANTIALPTVIFDEIDAGISGETAAKVAKILKGLANNHQVICITHLAQLAARGHTHYFIFKENDKHRTFTRVKLLEGEARIKAIAGMLSGESVSKAAIENARELVNQE